jgi:UPF0755 protein
MRRKLLISAVVLLLAAVSAGVWINRAMQHQLHAPMNVSGEATLVVKPGMSLTTIGRRLAQRGWLSHPYYFILKVRLKGLSRRIKAGEYSVKPGMTPLQLLDKLIKGKVIQYSLTIPEGLTFREIMQLVEAQPELRHTLPDDRPATVMQAIGEPGQSPEGRFYPDTYYFPRGTTDVEFLRRAYLTMSRVLAEEWQARDTGLPYKKPYDALIMASIIEKETAVPEERERIAGVFVRRLERGMRLQTDPTVIYALGKNYDGDIRRRDLATQSPYNTYVHAGLPPTPIAAPGRESIHAALHPEPGNALYFVSRGDGTHEFSSTLEEHNRAVAKYQLNGSHKPQATGNKNATSHK